MAKTNIKFNDKIYSIDEAALSAASTELKSHLSTVMNGEGAVITIDGTSYNIDSTKLSAAATDFVSHLGTIAGSGMKVIIGGIEYGIDSSKVAGAIAELEGALGNLSSEGKNEYKFYYNVPYVFERQINGYDFIQIMIFYEDGQVDMLMNFPDEGKPEIVGANKASYAYNEDNNTMMMDGITFSIGEDSSLSSNVDGFVIKCIPNTNMDILLHGVYYYDDVDYNYSYISNDGLYEARFYKDGSITLMHNNDFETIAENQWTNEYCGYINGRCHFCFSIDGEVLYISNYYSKNQEIKYNLISEY